MIATKPVPTIDEVSQRLWTCAEYERLGEVGIIGPDERTELIDGVIYRLTPQKSKHATGVRLAVDVARQAFPEGYLVDSQLPLVLGRRSEPEPDVSVLVGSARDYSATHPTSAVLVIEVSDTTLAYDRRNKVALYARARIPDYWIVNLVVYQLEVHRDPSPTGYRSVTILKPGDTIAPLARPDTPIAVADLLP